MTTVQTLPDRIVVAAMAAEYVPSFRECLDSVARDGNLLFQQAPPLPEVERFIDMLRRNGSPQFVAVDGTRVVGWCDITRNERRCFDHCGRLGMGVHGSYRRKGIGEALLRAAVGRAREIGLERIELEVFADNAPAIRLYEKMGFEREGINRKVRKRGDVYTDSIRMSLFLLP